MKCTKEKWDVWFWPVMGVVIIIITTVLCAVEVPLYAQDPVKPLMSVDEMLASLESRPPATAGDAALSLSYREMRALSAVREAGEALNHIFNQQAIFDYYLIAESIAERQKLYTEKSFETGAHCEDTEKFALIHRMYRMNHGPYDAVTRGSSFIDSTDYSVIWFPNDLPPGYGLYPFGMEMDDWNATLEYINEHIQTSEEKVSELKSTAEALRDSLDYCVDECRELRADLEKYEIEIEEVLAADVTYEDVLQSLLSPYSLVAEIPKNSLGVDYSGYYYSNQYYNMTQVAKEKLGNALNFIDDNDIKAYVEAVHGQLDSIGETDTLAMTNLWTKTAGNIELLAGPYNVGFDEFQGIKTSYVAWGGVVAAEKTRLMEAYRENVGAALNNLPDILVDGELVPSYVNPEYIPAPRAITALFMYTGALRPPQMTTLTLPTFQEMSMDTAHTITSRKAIFAVNVISSVFADIIQPIANAVFSPPLDITSDAYFQLVAAAEYGKLYGQRADCPPTFNPKGNLYPIEQMKGLLAGLLNIKFIADNAECDDAECQMPLACSNDAESPLPSCEDFTGQVTDVFVAQLLYMSRFDSSYALTVLARNVLVDLALNGGLEISDATLSVDTSNVLSAASKALQEIQALEAPSAQIEASELGKLQTVLDGLQGIPVDVRIEQVFF